MLLITTRTYPPELGGMQNLMGNLAIHLNILHPVKVLADSFKNDRLYDTKNNFETYRLDGIKLIRKYRKTSLLKQIFDEGGVKAIIADHWKSVETVPDFIANQIPVVCLIHGKEINHDLNNASNKRSIFALNKTKYIVANSNFTKNLAIHKGIESSKITVINPGINSPEIIENEIDQEAKKIFDNAEVKIITIARLDKRKGIDFSLFALKNFKTIHNNFKYVIIGNGEEEDNLKKIVKELSLENNVIFLKNINTNLKNALLKNANFFLMPTRINEGSVEGFGISYIEAASYGIPAIAGKEGGESDAVQHNKTGIICNGNDHGDIYEALKNIVENKKYLKLGNAAKEFAANFYWDKIIKKYANLLNL